MKTAIYILYLILLTGCSSSGNKYNSPKHEKLSKEDYKQWYSKESQTSLHNEQKIGGLTYSLSFMPGEVMAMYEVGDKANENKIKEVESDYDSMYYFILKLEAVNGTTELLKMDVEGNDQYQQRIEYCSFKIQSDIKLQLGEDEYIPCTVCHFERAYDIAPYVKFMVAFDRKTIDRINQSDITIVYEDHLFDNGPVKFTLDKQIFTQTPTLRL